MRRFRSFIPCETRLQTKCGTCTAALLTRDDESLSSAPSYEQSSGIRNDADPKRKTQDLTDALLQQTFVISHDQMAVDLLDKIERDADRDQQSGSSIETGNHVIDTQKTGNDRRDDGDQ